MVKLAKKRFKYMKEMEVIVPDYLSFMEKDGEYDFNELFLLKEPTLPEEAFVLLIALYAISEKDNKLQFNAELSKVAIILFFAYLDEHDGKINLKEFSKTYKYFKGLLDYLHKCHIVDHRKEKKFGEPAYPSFQQLADILERLDSHGLIDKNGVIKEISKYDLALIKQRLTNEGYPVPLGKE